MGSEGAWRPGWEAKAWLGRAETGDTDQQPLGPLLPSLIWASPVQPTPRLEACGHHSWGQHSAVYTAQLPPVPPSPSSERAACVPHDALQGEGGQRVLGEPGLEVPWPWVPECPGRGAPGLDGRQVPLLGTLGRSTVPSGPHQGKPCWAGTASPGSGGAAPGAGGGGGGLCFHLISSVLSRRRGRILRGVVGAGKPPEGATAPLPAPHVTQPAVTVPRGSA